jgi:thioredoxin-like negative regulator of GroEL
LFATPERAPEKRAEVDPADYDRLFIEARREYLRRNWERAQLLLGRQLSRFPRDAASRLMLATVHRHVGNAESALAELDQLELFDQSLAWKFEISRERLLIARQMSEQQDDGNEADNDEMENESEGLVRDLRSNGSDTSISHAA